ncbi:MAG: hypothetical protein ABIP49_05235 [Lysobacterales bacterium]
MAEDSHKRAVRATVGASALTTLLGTKEQHHLLFSENPFRGYFLGVRLREQSVDAGVALE